MTLRILEATDTGDDAFAVTLSNGDGALVGWRTRFEPGQRPQSILRVDVASDDVRDWLTDHAEQVWDACWLGRVSL